MENIKIDKGSFIITSLTADPVPLACLDGYVLQSAASLELIGDNKFQKIDDVSNCPEIKGLIERKTISIKITKPQSLKEIVQKTLAGK